MCSKASFGWEMDGEGLFTVDVLLSQAVRGAAIYSIMFNAI